METYYRTKNGIIRANRNQSPVDLTGYIKRCIGERFKFAALRSDDELYGYYSIYYQSEEIKSTEPYVFVCHDKNSACMVAAVEPNNEIQQIMADVRYACFVA